MAGYLINPHWGPEDLRVANQLMAAFPLDAKTQVGIPTSGTTVKKSDSDSPLTSPVISPVKFVIHEIQSLQSIAESYCEYFAVSSNDRILSLLPSYHVSGFMPELRARAAGCQFLSTAVGGAQWTERLVETCLKFQPTILSLVPTQVFDLVKAAVPAPKSLRVVHIGGAHLAPALIDGILKLGWPIRPSFGMTETGAMIASSQSPQGPLEPLPTVKYRIDEVQGLWVSSSSLFKVMLRFDGDLILEKPQLVQGFWQTSDLAEGVGSGFSLLGRRDRTIKILGELVSLDYLESQILKMFGRQAVVTALPDERRGFQLHATLESTQDLSEEYLVKFNSAMTGPQRLLSIKCVESLPKTDSLKLKFTQN